MTTLSIKAFSLEIEGDAAFVASAVKTVGAVIGSALAAAAPAPQLPPARVQRCGNCGGLGHKKPTCTMSGGGRGPA